MWGDAWAVPGWVKGGRVGIHEGAEEPVGALPRAYIRIDATVDAAWVIYPAAYQGVWAAVMAAIGTTGHPWLCTLLDLYGLRGAEYLRRAGALHATLRALGATVGPAPGQVPQW